MSLEGITAPAHNNKRDWSDHSVGVLRKMWSEGVAPRKIGDRLGRSASSIRGKASALRLPPRRATRGHTCNHYAAVRPIEYSEDKMRAENRRALEAYTKAVLESGGGSWGGHLSPLNSSGSYR